MEAQGGPGRLRYCSPWRAGSLDAATARRRTTLPARRRTRPAGAAKSGGPAKTGAAKSGAQKTGGAAKSAAKTGAAKTGAAKTKGRTTARTAPARPNRRRRSGPLGRTMRFGTTLRNIMIIEAVAAACVLGYALWRSAQGSAADQAARAASSAALVSRDTLQSGELLRLAIPVALLFVVLVVGAAAARRVPWSGGQAPLWARAGTTVALVAQLAALAGAIVIALASSAAHTKSTRAPFAAWVVVVALLAGVAAALGIWLALRLIARPILRPNEIFIVLGVLVLVVVVWLPATVKGAAVAAGFWAPATPTETGWFDGVDSVTCPTTTQCLSLADVLTNARGIHWGVATSAGPTGAAQLGYVGKAAKPTGQDLRAPNRLTCASTQVCLAWAVDQTNRAIWRTTDGGRSWTSPTAPGAAGAALNLSCTSSSTCFLLEGGTVRTSSDAGASWGAPATAATGDTPATTPVFLTVSCGTATDCVATGAAGGSALVSRTDDGGSTWRASTVPSGLGVVIGVVCAATRCLAVASTLGGATQGTVALTSSDGGTTFTRAGTLPLATATGLACATADRCAATGTAGSGGGLATTVDSGAMWRLALRVDGGLSTVSAPASGYLAGGFTNKLGAVIESSPDGASWTQTRFPREPAADIDPV